MTLLKAIKIKGVLDFFLPSFHMTHVKHLKAIEDEDVNENNSESMSRNSDSMYSYVFNPKYSHEINSICPRSPLSYFNCGCMPEAAQRNSNRYNERILH